MLALPPEGKRLLDAFRPAFTAPTYQRFLLLLIGAIVAMGRRTVSRILWASRCLNDGHPSSYHRFFSAARWSGWPLARVLAAAVLERIPADQPVTLAADDTVAEHRGKKVFGKGCHRDAVRSGSISPSDSRNRILEMVTSGNSSRSSDSTSPIER